MVDDKRAIIDELLTNGRIYVDEKAKMIIETVKDYDEVQESCSRCGGSVIEIYARPEELTSGPNDYDLVISRCENCDLFHAYWIFPITYDDSALVPAKEDEHFGGRIMEPQQWKFVGKPEWGEGKRQKFSEKMAKAYKMDALRLSALSRKLDAFVQSKLSEMYKAGLNIETINLARNKAQKFLRKNSASQKQLVALFAAAVYEAAHEELNMIGGQRWIGEKISERQLKNIFGVTRKTIRKWRKHIPPRTGDLYL